MPIQSRHPVAMAQQALSTQAVCDGRFTLGLGPSHHWIVEDMFGLPYERPAAPGARLSRGARDGARRTGTGRRRERRRYRVHNPLDITDLTPTPILIAALAPVMLQLAGEQAAGTILWMADERAIGDHVVPRITKAAAEAGRPAPRVVAGVPVTLCRNDEVDAVRAWANKALGHAEYSPNYQRLLEHGDASDVGDMCAAVTRRPSSPGCAASAMRAPPTSRHGCCPSAPTGLRGSSRVTGPSTSSLRCPSC